MLGLLEQYIDGLHADRQHLVRSYEVADMARKVVGIGSVGTRAWVILLVGRGGQDAVMLQAKEAQASVLEPYLGRSEYATHGERVVRGQRMMQAATDIFLSWQRSPDLEGVERDFYVRQLWDWKASADLSRMTEHGLLTYTRACAWSLARSHARSGDRLAIAAYLGKGRSFDRAIARFSIPLRRPERARPPPAAGSRRCRGDRGHRGDLTAVRRAGRGSAFPAQPARRSGQPTRISFLLTNSSAPYLPSSRPEPERLTPPNGSSAPSAPTMLTYTMPASISFATRSACSGSVVKR